jgi:hypothetical protein
MTSRMGQAEVEEVVMYRLAGHNRPVKSTCSLLELMRYIVAPAKRQVTYKA